MGLFNRKSKTTNPTIDPHQIQLDFYTDWFNDKYQKLFSSKYLEGLKYVKDLDIDQSIIDDMTKNSVPDTIDEAIKLTELHLDTIVSMQSAYITLGHKILESPALMLDDEFDTLYHETLPHIIEAIRLLDEYGTQNEYPFMRVNAVLRRVKYAPNFTIEAGDIAKQESVQSLDLSFYDRYDKIRLEMYTPMIKLIKRFKNENEDVNFKKSFAVIDDLLDISNKPRKDNQNV